MAVNIKQIAHQAGVHPSTVSLALRNSSRLPQATRARISEIAAKLNYRPNFMAKGLAGQKTQTIGIIVPKLRDLYVVDIIAAQERWLQLSGFAALLAVTHNDPILEKKAFDDLLGRGVDGLVLDYVPSDPEILSDLERMVGQGVPISFLGETSIAGVDQVTWDGVRCGYEVGKHLLSLGHRKIATISLGMYDGRGIGFKKAMEEAGMSVDPQLVFEIDYVFQDVTLLRKDIMSVKERPTAIFAYNDDLAGELMVELMDIGFRIPEDVSVVGVNDGWFSPRLRVPLTTYHLPQNDIGIGVVEPLVARITDPTIAARKKMFNGHLVVRKSTGPAPNTVIE
jgi:DNA-binding LacI/PurR family transcriptional regulator